MEHCIQIHRTGRGTGIQCAGDLSQFQHDVNNNNHPITKEIHVWEIGVPKTGKMKVILQSRDDGYCMEGAEYEIKAGKILIEMPQTSATILKYVQE